MRLIFNVNYEQENGRNSRITEWFLSNSIRIGPMYIGIKSVYKFSKLWPIAEALECSRFSHYFTIKRNGNAFNVILKANLLNSVRITNNLRQITRYVSVTCPIILHWIVDQKYFNLLNSIVTRANIWKSKWIKLH